MKKSKYQEIPVQTKLVHSIETIPIEYFKWGTFPDHFNIEMPHRHEFAELLFFTKGGGVHEIGFVDYEVETYSVHFIPESTVHFLKRDIYSDGFTIAFDTNYLEKNEIHRFINPLEHKPFTFSLTKNQFNDLLNQRNILLKRLQQARSNVDKKCFLLAMELLLNSLASEILQVTKCENDFIEGCLLRDFKYLVLVNIHQHHNLAWYATQLNVSVKYLGNYVKGELNISAKSYIISALLMAVKQELVNTNKPLIHIAIDYSLNNASLAKLFKKHVGYTMSAYRSGTKMDF